jgi:transposase
MDRPTAIPQPIWDSLTGEARAVLGAVIDGLERQLIELRQQVQELRARLDQNSSNSSKPPSSDPIGVKRQPPAPPSKRRRGGQEGHPRRIRALVSPEASPRSPTASRPNAGAADIR